MKDLAHSSSSDALHLSITKAPRPTRTGSFGWDVAIKGIDLKWHDERERYREVVSFIKYDPISLGALVTTHKLDLLKASRDFFDELDPYAQLTGEISCISKRDGKLVGHAKDPITAGFSLEAFLPQDHWEKTGAEVLVLGAVGSSVALTCHMLEPIHVEDGWIYFIHGWTRVIAEVFNVEIPVRGPAFEEISRIALQTR